MQDRIGAAIATISEREADPAILADLSAWAADTAPDIAPLIERHAGPEPLFERYDLEGEIARLSRVQAWVAQRQVAILELVVEDQGRVNYGTRVCEGRAGRWARSSCPTRGSP